MEPFWCSNSASVSFRSASQLLGSTALATFDQCIRPEPTMLLLFLNIEREKERIFQEERKENFCANECCPCVRTYYQYVRRSKRPFSIPSHPSKYSWKHVWNGPLRLYLNVRINWGLLRLCHWHIIRYKETVYLIIEREYCTVYRIRVKMGLYTTFNRSHFLYFFSQEIWQMNHRPPHPDLLYRLLSIPSLLLHHHPHRPHQSPWQGLEEWSWSAESRRRPDLKEKKEEQRRQ